MNNRTSNLAFFFQLFIGIFVTLAFMSFMGTKFHEAHTVIRDYETRRAAYRTATNQHRWHGQMTVYAGGAMSYVPDVEIGLRGDGVVVWRTNSVQEAR